MRVCKDCGETKSIEKFAFSGRGDNRKHQCNVCRAKYAKKWYFKNKKRVRQQYIKRTFGIEYGEYEKLYKDQKGLCYLCGTFKGKLSIDHNHTTGAVRSLLCTNCNIGLGHFKEDVSLLQKAIDYLNEKNSSI